MIHETRAVKVWVDCDLGIADLVEEINLIAGARTHTSCQGSIGEGGPEPYGPYIQVSWANEEVKKKLEQLGRVTVEGENHGVLHPCSEGAATQGRHKTQEG